MQSSLNRIEREYILESLAEALPALSLQQDGRFLSIPEKTYRVSGNMVELDDSANLLVSGTPVFVYFKHRKRGMFFESMIAKGNLGAAFLQIPSGVYKVAGESLPGTGCGMTLKVQDASFEFRESEKYPLDLVFIDPEVGNADRAAAGKLFAALGLDETRYGNTPLFFRLREYLENANAKEAGKESSQAFLYADSDLAVISVSAGLMNSLRVGDGCPAEIRCVRRRIVCPAKVRGLAVLDPATGIVCLDISGIQLEDKRFLHERLFRTRFQG